ncbi:SRF-TF-domain-containing protein [Suhomyces tanzawaensis NRRL Y-17324]|uniref:SRF-TF-domain-containing protein n=1 Tax=Suhomyces tanzawaensis NRRL Y-17324 TaxID=984487 RepID=A0A1E4SRI9_9ASCO|nr:SRF-TF-domain-containing protein [Suhomyces tanzawaensis NRRL Y-17324]ODV82121.1 SRF-TF-domain-containing protein [Suhomyces tanzawaensis NRRL Y-17324]
MSGATEAKLETADQQYDGSNVGPASNNPVSGGPGDDDDDDEPSGGKQQKERRKIEIKFIQDKSRRHITFSKRKAGIMKKAYELSVLTGTQVLLLVVSETGLVYTFTTPKLQPLVTKSEGKNLIQACLNAPEEGLGDDQGEQSDGNSQDLPDQSPAANNNVAVQQQQAAQQAAQAHHNQQVQAQQAQAAAAAQQQLPPGAHIPHGIPYPNAGHTQPGMPLPQNAYGDSSQVYQYFSNIQNGNIPNAQQYQ